jgi:lipoprotein signal peptidase
MASSLPGSSAAHKRNANEVGRFIDVHVAGYHWPSFNLAASALSIGMVLLIIDGLFEGGKVKPRPFGGIV